MPGGSIRRAAVVVALLCHAFLSLRAETAVVSGTRGTVSTSAQSTGPWEPCGSTLAAGRWLRTGAGASAVIDADAGRLAVGENALLRFDGDRFRLVHFTLGRGRASARIDALGRRAAFSVSTPVVTAAVRGTQYEAEVTEAGGVRLALREGLVTARDGETESTVGPGQVLEADPFGGLSVMTESAARDIAAWREVLAVASLGPDTVTNRFRPVVFRQLGLIRATFDRVLALYEERGAIEGSEAPEEEKRARLGKLRETAEEMYLAILEGRGRVEAVAVVVHAMKESHGVPAPWIDEALVSYRGIWDGWLEMIASFIESLP